MSARNVYTALTPDYADFAIPGDPSSSVGAETSAYADIVDEEEQPVGRWRSRYLVAAGIVKGNLGLLLVTGSQAFFSFMNLAVKKLNNVDPPVSTFEVRHFY